MPTSPMDRIAELREDGMLHDLWIVLDELQAHQENTGEFLEDDDAGIIQQIKEAHPRIPAPTEQPAAATAGEPPPVSAREWRPIATVPKDKTVDLWLSSSDGVEQWRETDCWWNADRKLWSNLRGQWDCATHWMPKPLPPRSAHGIEALEKRS